MNVQVRYCLTYPVVDGNEGTFRIHRRFHRLGKQLRSCEHRPGKPRWKICQGFIMLTRAQQHMSWEQRIVIEKRYAISVFINDLRRQSSSRDFTKKTTGLFHGTMLIQARYCSLGKDTDSKLLTLSTSS
jgi:hypothetical protein